MKKTEVINFLHGWQTGLMGEDNELMGKCILVLELKSKEFTRLKAIEHLEALAEKAPESMKSEVQKVITVIKK